MKEISGPGEELLHKSNHVKVKKGQLRAGKPRRVGTELLSTFKTLQII